MSESTVLFNAADDGKSDLEIRRRIVEKKNLKKTKLIFTWIWKNMWLILGIFSLMLNASLFFIRRRFNNQLLIHFNAGNVMENPGIFLNFEDYIQLQSSCQVAFCLKFSCFCISKERSPWYSAKIRCKNLFKGASLVTTSIEPIIKHIPSNIDNIWIGAYVDEFGKSVYINNEKLPERDRGRVTARHCIAKRKNYFIRESCLYDDTTFRRFVDVLCKIKFQNNAETNITVTSAYASNNKSKWKKCSITKCRNTSCYCLLRMPFSNFQAADKECKKCFSGSESGLVYFEDKQEVDFVLSHFSDRFMIGATDFHETNKWEWIGNKQGIDISHLPNFFEKNMQGCYRSSPHRSFFPLTYFEEQCFYYFFYICQFPFPKYNNGIFPLSAIYDNLLNCKIWNCSERFKTCYCFMSSYEPLEWGDLCNASDIWSRLTIKNENELKYVQSIIKRNMQEYWIVGANNFIERGQFQWIDNNGMELQMQAEDFKCITVSEHGLEMRSCFSIYEYICAINLNKVN